MSGIRIISPGLLSTIQDAGRTGFMKYGMPLSGAMDDYSFRVANLIVGNRVNEACIEATIMGPAIEFLSRSVFAITGAPMQAELNGVAIENWQSHKARKGDILTFGYCKEGARSYIAVSGGLDIPEVMGSRSTYLPGSIGGYSGRKLEKDDIISTYPFSWLDSKKIKLPPEMIPSFPEQVNLRFTKGRDMELFDGGSVAIFTGSLYTLSSDSNRMGYRLTGADIDHTGSPDVLSYAVVPGTIQIPGDKKPIIMMKDCQTTGGYTQIGNIITADLHIAGQLKPGDKIRFEMVDNNQAVEAWKHLNKSLSSFFGKKRAVICTACFTK